MTLIGTDVSGWQAGNVNLSGLAFVISKATQGTTYVNPNHAAQIAQARGAGLLIGHYHFADGNTPEDEVAFFLRNAAWQPGDILALDVEHPFTDNCADVVGWSLRFHTELHRRTGVWGLHYMDAGTRGRFDWTRVAKLGPGLWDAEYNATGPYSSAPWDAVAIWQNSDTNISGGDSDQFYGDATAWHKYGTPGGGAVKPTPAPVKPAPAPVKPAPKPAVKPAPAPVKPAPKPAVKPTQCIVQAGDTLSSIAAQFGVTLAALEAANPGINYDLIHPDQVLNLPGHAPAPAVRKIRVEAGDTLSSIAAQFGTTVAHLVAVNHLQDPNRIFPDQILVY